MIDAVEKDILRKFDRQKIKANEIAIIMDKLDNKEKQYKFLSFLMENRNELLSYVDMLKNIKC